MLQYGVGVDRVWQRREMEPGEIAAGHFTCPAPSPEVLRVQVESMLLLRTLVRAAPQQVEDTAAINRTCLEVRRWARSPARNASHSLSLPIRIPLTFETARMLLRALLHHLRSHETHLFLARRGLEASISP